MIKKKGRFATLFFPVHFFEIEGNNAKVLAIPQNSKISVQSKSQIVKHFVCGKTNNVLQYQCKEAWRLALPQRKGVIAINFFISVLQLVVAIIAILVEIHISKKK